MTKIPGFTHHIGKGSVSELLPSRHALNQLTAGATPKRGMNNYARATPSGSKALGAPSVLSMGKSGASLER